MLRKHPKLFQDPHIQYPHDDLNLPFAEYINKTRSIIATHRLDLHYHPAAIINANSPFELNTQSKSKKGILLIHGLLDTPFLMKDMANSLQDQDLLIRSVLLPGHGTVPGALLKVTYEDWLQTIIYGVNSLKKEVDEIYLAGFSTGAALSIYHTLRDPEKISGIIMLSPAFKIKSELSFTLDWNKKINWKWQRAHWFYIGTEYDYTKYRSVPFNAVYQVYQLSRQLKKANHTQRPQCPLFIAMSYNDLIVCSLEVINYFLGDTHPQSQFILYSPQMHPFNDPRIVVRNSSYPEWNIVNFSHISIPFAPTNNHYGIHGDYPFASHVEQNKNCIYGALDKPRKWFYDTMYQFKLTPYKHQRLTFNPDFDFMMEQIKNFIQHSSLPTTQTADHSLQSKTTHLK